LAAGIATSEKAIANISNKAIKVAVVFALKIRVYFFPPLIYRRNL